jgi:hypothetical protein
MIMKILNAKYANVKKNMLHFVCSKRDWLIGLPLLVSFHFRSVGAGIDSGLKCHHFVSRNRNGKPMLISTIQPELAKPVAMGVNRTYFQRS